jgi:RNA polymerase sigma factor (sigma-70 family)
MGINDWALLRAAQDGDDEAFSRLFSQHYPLVFSIALRITGRPEDAEDVTQEVFLQLYHHPPVRDNDAGIRPWLARVATNVARNMLRQQRRLAARTQRYGQLEQPIADESIELTIARRETVALVRQLLEGLPERDRLLLSLRAAGLSYREIADALDLRESSIGKLLARAEERFRARYVELTGEELA